MLNAPPRVLVVDDDLETVEAMALVIKSFGHDVQFAVSGRGAIEVARKFRPSVVILDVHLPDLEGDKVTAELKRELGRDNVRVIAISGDDETRKSALDAGCAEFHEKPVSAHLLQRLLS